MAQGNISEFTSPVDSLHPTEVGVDAFQQAGAKANRIFTELGASHEQTGRQVAQDIGGGIKAAGQAAEDFIDHQQLSRGIASKATIIDTLGQTWDNAVKDAAQNNPNSTTTADTFKQNVLEPELEAWGKGFTTEKGQLWYQEQADRIREHFNTVTAAGMGQLAAHGSSVDLKTAVNGWNNTAMRDPGQVPLLLDSIPKDIKALVNSYPGARGIDAVKMATDYTLQAQEGAVKGGMFGAVQKAAVDPNGDPAAVAQAWLKTYPQFITEANAEHVTNIALADQKARVAVQQRQEKDTALAQTDKYVQDAASPAPKLSQASIWTDPAYANRPDLRAEAAGVLEKMRSFNDKMAAVDPALSHTTSQGILSRMTLPDGDPNKITDRQELDKAFQSNQLDKTDYTFVLGQLKALSEPGEKQVAKAREDFFKDYKVAIAPTTVMGTSTDPKVLQFEGSNLFAAKQEAIRQEQALKQQGKDPKSLYDPNSPDYFGKPENLVKFQSSLTDQLHSQNTTIPGDMGKYAIGIKGIEGGNYAAQTTTLNKNGQSQTAYGAYQVIGANVGPWTEKYYGRRLTPQEFVGNKAAQDAVFQGEFGRLVAAHGPEGAARAWYAGESGMNNLQATDAFHKLTVGAYGDRFAKATGSSITIPPGMHATDVIAKYPPGTKVRLPDGTIGTVPQPAAPVSH